MFKQLDAWADEMLATVDMIRLKFLVALIGAVLVAMATFGANHAPAATIDKEIEQIQAEIAWTNKTTWLESIYAVVNSCAQGFVEPWYGD